MNITPINQTGPEKTGELLGITEDGIQAILGFPPNVTDDPTKVVHSWGFDIDGYPCGIWDYKGSHIEKRFSTYGNAVLLKRLFGQAYRPFHKGEA